MKQYAIIGIGVFGKQMLEELLEIGDCELIVIDKDREIIETYKNLVTRAYIMDVLKEEAINKVIPNDIDAVIIDLGERIEASILVTNYLKKMEIKNIIAKAESDEHAEILELIGARKVIFPNREAAKRIAPLLVAPLISSFMPISKDFVIAEIKPPDEFVGLSLLQINLRKQYSLNVIAFRKETEDDYAFFYPEYQLQADDVFLLAGSETDMINFAKIGKGSNKGKKEGFFRHFLSRFKKQ